MADNGHAEELRVDFSDNMRRGAKIKVLGVGGGGGNAVNRMIDESIVGVDFIAVNTDQQALMDKYQTSLQVLYSHGF